MGVIAGSSNINMPGSRLLKFLIGTELPILNLGSEPTFFSLIRGEGIDITVAFFGMATLVEAWKILNDLPLGSPAHYFRGLGCTSNHTMWKSTGGSFGGV